MQVDAYSRASHRVSAQERAAPRLCFSFPELAPYFLFFGSNYPLGIRFLSSVCPQVAMLVMKSPHTQGL